MYPPRKTEQTFQIKEIPRVVFKFAEKKRENCDRKAFYRYFDGKDGLLCTFIEDTALEFNGFRFAPPKKIKSGRSSNILIIGFQAENYSKKRIKTIFYKK